MKFRTDYIRKCYFCENFMRIKCQKPPKLKNVKINRASFYGVKISQNNTYYIKLKIDKEYCFGPFYCLEHALLYHDWIKFIWLINNGQWLKNNKKQYSNWGYVLDKIEKNEVNIIIKKMFTEFSLYFDKYLDMSKPEPKKISCKQVKHAKKDNTKSKLKKRKKCSLQKSKKCKIDKCKIDKCKIDKCKINKLTECEIKYCPKKTRPKRLSDIQMKELLNIQSNKCALCFKNMDFSKIDWEVDHCIPWSLNGGNCINNLQIVHLHCHKIKSRLIDKKFKEFINKNIKYKNAKMYCRALFKEYNNEINSKKKIFS